MKYKRHLFTGACIAALTICGSLPAFAASQKKESSATGASASPSASAAASPAEKAPRAIPFHGTVSAVDASAKTFTIAGKTSSRVFKVTDKTTVMKDTATGTFTDITANAKVSGSYWKQGDGSLECKSVKVTAGDATSSASPAASASPSASAKKK